MVITLQRLLSTCVLLLAVLVHVPLATAQSTLGTPAPLMPRVTDPPPSDALLLLTSAQRALELGFPSAAIELYKKLLAHPAVQGEVRNQIALAWVTAAIDEGRLDEARHALTQYKGEHLAAPNALRIGLVHAHSREWENARAAVEVVKPEQLSQQDRGWYFYLRGLVAAGMAPDIAQGAALAAPFYQQAIKTVEGNPTLEYHRVHFTLYLQQAEILMGFNFSNDRLVREARQEFERAQGGNAGYRAARNLAIALHGASHRNEAIDFLNRQLQSLPREEKAVADEWQLLLGFIAGAEDGVGRNALFTLLIQGTDRDKQRVALVLLGRATKDRGRREDFRKRLGEVISSTPDHPLIEEMLLFRAEAALLDKDHRAAEDDALTLVKQFPGSRLKAFAYGVLTNVAWDAGRYRNATSAATEARNALPAGETHARLGVLIAEAFFRAGETSREPGDFRNAADAYGAALNEVPGGVKPGDLIFQRIESEIQAGRLDEAEALLDQAAADPRLDPVNRWHAESNLVRALQGVARTPAAYARVNRLLAGSVSNELSTDLKIRMAFLQARLAYEVGEYDRTQTLADALLGSVASIEPELKAEISSKTLLLQAEAHIARDQPESNERGINLLKRLRTEYPGVAAASHSYIVQANFEVRKRRLEEARKLLVALADSDPQHLNSLAPYALVRAALLDEQMERYDEANHLIERLVTSYPASSWVFYARKKQGDVFRTRGQFGYAEAAYDAARKAFPRHKDVPAVELALADCHNFQAANDPGHRELAAQGYLHLYETANVSADIRVEAGFKYGLLLDVHEKPVEAQAVWAGLVAQFVTDDAAMAGLSSSGRYWVARTLAYLGDLYRRTGKLEPARQAYNLIISKALPGVEEARERLSHVQGTAAK